MQICDQNDIKIDTFFIMISVINNTPVIYKHFPPKNENRLFYRQISLIIVNGPKVANYSTQIRRKVKHEQRILILSRECTS